MQVQGCSRKSHRLQERSEGIRCGCWESRSSLEDQYIPPELIRCVQKIIGQKSRCTFCDQYARAREAARAIGGTILQRKAGKDGTTTRTRATDRRAQEPGAGAGGGAQLRARARQTAGAKEVVAAYPRAPQSCFSAHARARETFTVVFYGPRIFCCKTAQTNDVARQFRSAGPPMKSRLRKSAKNCAKFVRAIRNPMLYPAELRAL